MPTTRRSTRASTGVAAGKQSKLSFQHKVTKPISHPGKEEAKLPARTKEHIPDDQEEVASKKLKKEDEETVKPEEQEETDVKDEEEEQEEQEEEKSTLKTPFEEAEARAAKLNDREIAKYWKEIEASRRAKELHKKHAEGLSTAEKVLRHFDVSSQYGPCVGITRLKRWQRAQRLGLNPPLEVLAVLIKEENKGNKDIEQAHMDVLLNSTAVGSVGV